MYTLIAIRDTFLKQTTGQSFTLVEQDKYAIALGTEIPITGFVLIGIHLRISLGKDRRGHQISFHGLNSWYVSYLDVTIMQAGKIVQIVPISQQSDRSINDMGFRLLTTFESCHLTAYQGADKRWMIGFGTTRNVQPGQRITPSQAENFLRKDLHPFEKAVLNYIQVPLNDDQFSSLICFIYNIGDENFRDSTLRFVLNRGDYQVAANHFLHWNQISGTEIPELTYRRQAERALFLSKLHL